MLDESRLQEEVDKRIALLMENEDALMRYDLNGNGVIDDWEWEEIRRVINAQVQTQWRRNVLDWQAPVEQENDGQSALWAPSTEMLRDRYDITQDLGQGAQGFAFLGRDIYSGQAVAIKKLPRAHIGDAQLTAFFAEEWPHLSTLTHPGVAPYIDAFEQDDYFILVQEHVDGESLEQMLRRGVRFSEADVRRLIAELLEVLADLHDHHPPILHRDVKPSNIIRRPDGRYVLVDFGALPASREGVVVGTSGYTPVEELMGHSLPASDLYGLGATAIHLLSHIHPADMPIEFMQIIFRPFVDVSDELADFLARLVEPHADHRFASAGEALRALDRSSDGLHETRRQFVLILKARRASPGKEGLSRPRNATSLVRHEEPPADIVEFEDEGPSLTVLIITAILAFGLGYLMAVQPI